MLQKRGKVITKHGCKLAHRATRCVPFRFPMTVEVLRWFSNELELTSYTTFFCIHPTFPIIPFSNRYSLIKRRFRPVSRRQRARVPRHSLHKTPVPSNSPRCRRRIPRSSLDPFLLLSEINPPRSAPSLPARSILVLLCVDRVRAPLPPLPTSPTLEPSRPLQVLPSPLYPPRPLSVGPVPSRARMVVVTTLSSTRGRTRTSLRPRRTSRRRRGIDLDVDSRTLNGGRSVSINVLIPT